MLAWWNRRRVNFRQSSEAKQQPIVLLQQPRYLRAQHILSLVASARSGSYGLYT